MNVSGIIIPPYFRLPTALLDWENNALRWLGPFGSGFLSPQPPGIVRAGPNAAKFGGQHELALSFCHALRWSSLVAADRSLQRTCDRSLCGRRELPTRLSRTSFCQCGGFDIRFSSAASPRSECQIQNRTGILYLLVSLWF